MTLEEKDIQFLEDMRDTDFFWSRVLLDKMAIRGISNPEIMSQVIGIADAPAVISSMLSYYSLGLDKLIDGIYNFATPEEKSALEAILPANAMAFDDILMFFKTIKSEPRFQTCGFINGMKEFGHIIRRGIRETEM